MVFVCQIYLGVALTQHCVSANYPRAATNQSRRHNGCDTVEFMDEQNEDFWVTNIATTPEQDAEFSTVGRILAIICCGQIVIACLAVLLVGL
jgi:hypothetical protein